jgi:hypothetical protein
MNGLDQALQHGDEVLTNNSFGLLRSKPFFASPVEMNDGEG